MMKCGEVKMIEWPKAVCNTTAYDPAVMVCDKGVLSYSFYDERDSIKYKAVVIGTQIWMAENLRYSGSAIAPVGVCYEGYNISNPSVSADSVAKSCAKYGRMYRWATAMAFDSTCNSNYCANKIQAKHNGICPSGWHIPTANEWVILTDFAGGEETAGEKLKATSGWNEWNKRVDGWVSSGTNSGQGGYDLPVSGGGTDDYGFSALPGGRGSTADYYSVGSCTEFWTSFEDAGSKTSANYRYVCSNSKGINSGSNDKSYFNSIRCVKD